MSSNQALIDSTTIRQILVQRYSKGEAKRLFKHLQRLSKELSDVVGTDYAVSRSVSIANKIQRISSEILNEYGDDLTDGVKQFAQKEADFAGRAMVAATTASEYAAPSVGQVLASLTDTKMELLAGKSTAKLTVDEAIKQFSTKKAAELGQIVRDGAITGRTLDEIAREITGFIDTRTKHQAESLVRTVTNHVGAQARAATYKENDDVITGEEYVATLDSRTTVSCAGLDGKVFPIGAGPMPPLHWSCRSVRTPIVNPKYNAAAAVTGKRSSIDGPVSAQTTYGGWLKKQSHAVQNEVLGIDRASLFRSGKLAIGKFIDDSGKVYTLEELQRLNPIAFTEA